MKKIRIVELIGGLGNQMFQYAFFQGMKHKYPQDYAWIDLKALSHYDRHNGYELERIFSIPDEEIKGWKRRLLLKNKIFRNHLTSVSEKGAAEFEWPDADQSKWIHYYKGYWQSEKYFQNINSDIRRLFTFRHDRINEENRQWSKHISADPLAVSLHIRRGDYINNSDAYVVHGGICTLDYYKAAMLQMEKKLGCTPHYYLFSDDVQWTKEHLDMPGLQIIDINRKTDSWQDMFLMSQCRHNIIANSSFSWWGAWLNSNPEKQIIAPGRWFNTLPHPDIIPDNWITISLNE